MIPKFLSIKDHILDKTVHDTAEEKVGVIQDVFINPDTNKPVFVFLSEGGFLGLGSDTYALPWPMLEFNTNSGAILLQVRRDKLTKAPKVDMEKLKNYDRKEVEQLFDYYGYRDFLAKGDVHQEDYQAERNTNHPHEGYEGAAKITGEGPESQPADEMDYDKMKGLK
uniref:PRC-barrel domain-containing protein n=1 Tax=Roseihalotalea indica TaxID=2867963 RepID=A0AA49JEC6_9BACT|nr:PRC-barrel domain-containing protein [Tunicatimonas sp. TK19036]